MKPSPPPSRAADLLGAPGLQSTLLAGGPWLALLDIGYRLSGLKRGPAAGLGPDAEPHAPPGSGGN